MKLKKLFEDVMAEPYFDYDVDEDRVTIKAILNKQVIGTIVIESVFDAYHDLQDVIEDPKIDFDDSDYNKIFPNDTFTKIEYLDVIDSMKGNGIAKLLMSKAISHAKKNGEKVMYLNASPMGNSGLNVNDLVGFYKSFGFQPIIDDGHNVEMFMSI